MTGSCWDGWLGSMSGRCGSRRRRSAIWSGVGLSHPELVDTFDLGFANRTLGYRLPAKNRRAGADIRGRLQRLGVLRESGHEHLSGSLVVPILDS